MQLYSIFGEWKRSAQPKNPWRTWTVKKLGKPKDSITGFFKIENRKVSMVAAGRDGKPQDKPFAVGQVTASSARDLASLAMGPIGINSEAQHPTIDLWGAGIRKLGTLTVTNDAIFDKLFG